MTKDEIRAELIAIMKVSTPRDVDWSSVSDASEVTALGFDSLALLDLLYEVQEKFKLKFDAEDLVGAKTIGDFIAFIQSRVA